MYCSAFPDEVGKTALHVTSVGSLVLFVVKIDRGLHSPIYILGVVLN
jgi:hypothetical protein